MKRNITNIGIVALLLCTVAGCGKKPEVETKNGVSYARENENSAIEKIVEQGEQDISGLFTDTAEGKRLNWSCGEGERKLVINAVVEYPEGKKASVVTVKPAPERVKKEKIIKRFFGNQDNVVEVSDKDLKEEEKTSEEDTEKAVIIDMAATEKMYLKSRDGKIVCYRVNDAGLYYGNVALLEKCLQIDNGEGKEEMEKDISKEDTISSAKEEALKVLKEVGVEKAEILSGKTISSSSKEGYYILKFAPVVNGLPLAVNDKSQDDNKIIDVLGEIQIINHEVAQINANDVLWQEVSGKDDTCFGVGKALEILEEYVAQGEIPCDASVTYTRCELVYLPVTEDWKEAKLIPVWRFWIPAEELIKKTDMESVYEKNIPTDICINALNGKIETMQ